MKLHLHNLGHRYGARVLFRGIEHTAAEGSVTIVTGPNGAGKSTLLRIAADLLLPWEGSALLYQTSEAVTGAQRKMTTGYVSPEMALYSEFTGAENLAFYARLRGLQPDNAFLRSALEKVGLKGRGRDRYADYSSGMKQRLKIAVAQLGEPMLLLLDEPGTNLDRSGAEILQEALQEVRNRKGIALLATNEPDEELWGDEKICVNAV